VFLDPAARTDQLAAGFVCPLGERQRFVVVNDVLMSILLFSFSRFRTTVFA
jgi:hypothetical protein